MFLKQIPAHKMILLDPLNKNALILKINMQIIILKFSINNNK